MRVQDYYNKRYGENRAVFGTEPHKVVVELADRLPPQSTVLDLGAGQGRHTFYLANRGHRVTAVELTERGCSQIQTTAEQEGISLDACIEGDIRDASILAQLGTYDAVISVGVFISLDPLGVERVAAAMRERTNPLGYIAVSAFMEPDPEKRKEYLAGGDYYLFPGELQDKFAGMAVHFY